MSKGVHDLLTLVVIFLRVNWQQKHITLCLFISLDTNGQSLAKNLTKLLDIMGWTKINVAYVKNKGSNLNVGTTTMKSIGNCDIFGLGAFKEDSLAIHFQNHTNMPQQIKKYVKPWDMYLSRLHN